MIVNSYSVNTLAIMEERLVESEKKKEQARAQLVRNELDANKPVTADARVYCKNCLKYISKSGRCGGTKITHTYYENKVEPMAPYKDNANNNCAAYKCGIPVSERYCKDCGNWRGSADMCEGAVIAIDGGGNTHVIKGMPRRDQE